MYKELLFYRGNSDNNWKIVIPSEIKKGIIKHTHEKLGHPGVYKTLTYIKKFYFWRAMSKDVKRHVVRCDLCQRVKYLSIAMEGPYQLVRSEKPSDLITVDFYGPLPRGRGGVEYIFVVLDAFSKLVRLYPLRKATTKAAVNKILNNYVLDCGKPERILSDNGTQFTSAKWKSELHNASIKVVYSSIRHPQSNPTERVMREIGRLFRTFCEKRHTSWPNYVSKIEDLLNITTHFSTECTPIELHFGKPVKDEILKFVEFPEPPKIDHQYLISFARSNIEKNFAVRKHSQKTYKVALKMGDLVLLRVRYLSNAIDKVTKKFFHLFEGPYRIEREIGQNAFALVDPNDNDAEKGIYNRANLRKYYADYGDEIDTSDNNK